MYVIQSNVDQMKIVSNNVMSHHYYVRDHLGSTRAVIDDAGNLLQTVNYYPSGVPFTLTDDDTVTDRLHTGKPFIDMQGLGYYDNNARFLDILTGSFISVDPLAGKYPSLTPYNHCANNPNENSIISVYVSRTPQISKNK